MVRNAAMEAKNQMRKIKAELQPSSRNRHPSTLMFILGGNPSIQMARLGIIIQARDNNSMIPEALEEYMLTYAEAYYEDPGQQSPMVFMASGG